MNPSADELRSLPVLASLSAAELEDSCRYYTVRSYPKNAIVVTEGDEVGFSGFILSGSAQAFWRDDAGYQLKLGIEVAGRTFRTRRWPGNRLPLHGPPFRTCGSPAFASTI